MLCHETNEGWSCVWVISIGGVCVSEYSTVGVLHAGAGSVRGAACARAAVPVAGELGVADDRRCAAWDGVCCVGTPSKAGVRVHLALRYTAGTKPAFYVKRGEMRPTTRDAHSDLASRRSRVSLDSPSAHSRFSFVVVVSAEDTPVTSPHSNEMLKTWLKSDDLALCALSLLARPMACGLRCQAMLGHPHRM